jgi:ABC-type transport system involved in multi-copper enzyme maturation permease subunit
MRDLLSYTLNCVWLLGGMVSFTFMIKSASWSMMFFVYLVFLLLCSWVILNKCQECDDARWLERNTQNKEET